MKQLPEHIISLKLQALSTNFQVDYEKKKKQKGFHATLILVKIKLNNYRSIFIEFLLLEKCCNFFLLFNISINFNFVASNEHDIDQINRLLFAFSSSLLNCFANSFIMILLLPSSSLLLIFWGNILMINLENFVPLFWGFQTLKAFQLGSIIYSLFDQKTDNSAFVITFSFLRELKLNVTVISGNVKCVIVNTFNA